MCIEQAVSLEERRHGSEQFQCRLWFLFQGWQFSRSPLRHWRLQAATSRWPMAFDPEGLPLDQGVSLNCGIRD